MNKIPTSFKLQLNSTQAQKAEEVSHVTIFSRGIDSGRKLLLSLKNLFSRNKKSTASAEVAKAVPQATIEPIKTPQTKKVKFDPNNLKIETPMASNFTEISNKAAEKKSNQLQELVSKDPVQLSAEKSFKDSFATSLKIKLNETFTDSNLFVRNVVNAADIVMTRQMNDASQELKKENIQEEIKTKLNSQFANSIADETMDSIINAVGISFDFADAEELRKMQTGEFR